MTQSRQAASVKCCHETSTLRKEWAQPDTLLAPAVLGRPASPAPQSLERGQATSGMCSVCHWAYHGMAQVANAAVPEHSSDSVIYFKADLLPERSHKASVSSSV